jgi:hypothetical protein
MSWRVKAVRGWRPSGSASGERMLSGGSENQGLPGAVGKRRLIKDDGNRNLLG